MYSKYDISIPSQEIQLIRLLDMSAKENIQIICANDESLSLINEYANKYGKDISWPININSSTRSNNIPKAIIIDPDEMLDKLIHYTFNCKIDTAVNITK